MVLGEDGNGAFMRYMMNIPEYHIFKPDELIITRMKGGKCLCLCHIPSGALCKNPYCCERHWEMKMAKMISENPVKTKEGWLDYEEVFLCET